MRVEAKAAESKWIRNSPPSQAPRWQDRDYVRLPDSQRRPRSRRADGVASTATVVKGNLEIVRGLYEAMNTRDAASTRDFFHPDARNGFQTAGSGRALFGDARTSSGFSLTGRRCSISYSPRSSSLGRRAGYAVLGFLRVEGRGHASGAEFELRIGHLWTLRDGRVVCGRGFGDRNQALEAAGISE